MKWEKFKHLFSEGWHPKIQPLIEGELTDNIYKFLKSESSRGKIICPESKNTYRAFEETPYEELKVVWIGQDPYPFYWREQMTADGIAFSCAITKRLQPSLEELYKGMESDLCNGLNLRMIKEFDLSYLCKQGIMLLNSALTVEKEKPGSHFEIWKPWMRYLIEEILVPYNPGLIYVLCGKQAQLLEGSIDPLNNHILKVEHPASAAHQFRSWNHDHIFTKINRLLKEYYNYEPEWFLECPF